MQKIFFIGYLISLHLLLILMLVKSDFITRVGYRFGFIRHNDPEITQHYEQTIKFYERIDANVPNGTAIFLGDSSIQGLCVSAVVNPSVNFGIGTDTTIGLLKRLPKYQSLKRASMCVIAIGGNDIKRRDNEEILKNYSAILQAVPPHLPVVFSAVVSIDEHVRDDLIGKNRRILELNNGLETICKAQGPKCTFVDPNQKLVDASGNLRKEYHEGDGVHLNGVGNSIWIQELKEIILKVHFRI
ncbi:GDSL-type esterase/lipase family protein [uncultured Desulfobulbus sp.]|uniref:GDSL-type esterase/lipase family protein n=1 Tax=uncultured Desulfobulbus sp. TaxID=239745 RepID=UPI0029C661F5|nr:GDSL-type esterase/lipase family protein [uncultured Desulfobulbus sp.]